MAHEYKAAYEFAVKELREVNEKYAALLVRKIRLEDVIRKLSVQLGIEIPKELRYIPKKGTK